MIWASRVSAARCCSIENSTTSADGRKISLFFQKKASLWRRRIMPAGMEQKSALQMPIGECFVGLGGVSDGRKVMVSTAAGKGMEVGIRFKN